MKKRSVGIVFMVLGLVIAILIGLYFYLPISSVGKKTALFEETLKIVLLTIIILLSLFSIGFGVRTALSPENRLRKGLRELEKQALQKSSSELGESYLHLYELYIKLSERQKQNFYSQVVSLRQQLEENLRTEKQTEHMLEEVKKGTFTERKKTFSRLEQEYDKLPQQVKDRLYPDFLHVKEELEKGV